MNNTRMTQLYRPKVCPHSISRHANSVKYLTELILHFFRQRSQFIVDGNPLVHLSIAHFNRQQAKEKSRDPYATSSKPKHTS